MTKKHLKICLIFTGIIAILILNCSLVCAQPETNNSSVGDESTSAAPTSEGAGSEILLPDIKMAEDFLADEEIGPKGSSTGFKYWMNLIVALAIVLAFIYGLLYVVRYLFARLPAYRGRDDFKVLNSLRLSTHSTLIVVRFVDDIYLLAVTAQNVSVVARVSDPEKVQDIVDSMSAIEGVNPHAFSTLLSKRMTREIESDDLKNKQQTLSDDQQHFKDTADRLKGYDSSDDREAM